MSAWLWVGIGILVGGTVGYIWAVFGNRRKTIGTLWMEDSDPAEAPYLFLEVEPGGMNAIRRSKTVALKVQRKTR